MKKVKLESSTLGVNAKTIDSIIFEAGRDNAKGINLIISQMQFYLLYNRD